MAKHQILTVADRAMVAVVLRLRQIQEANGYNFTVQDVRRRAAPGWGAGGAEIALFFGHIAEARRGTREDLTYETQATQVRFAADGVDDDAIPADRVARYFIGDIRKCLNEKQLIYKSSPPAFEMNPIVDPFYPRGFVRAYSDGARIFQSTDPRRVAGVCFFNFTYWYITADPHRWHPDDVHVREEQLADVGMVSAG